MWSVAGVCTVLGLTATPGRQHSLARPLPAVGPTRLPRPLVVPQRLVVAHGRPECAQVARTQPGGPRGVGARSLAHGSRARRDRLPGQGHPAALHGPDTRARARRSKCVVLLLKDSAACDAIARSYLLLDRLTAQYDSRTSPRNGSPHSSACSASRILPSPPPTPSQLS